MQIYRDQYRRSEEIAAVLAASLNLDELALLYQKDPKQRFGPKKARSKKFVGVAHLLDRTPFDRGLYLGLTGRKGLDLCCDLENATFWLSFEFNEQQKTERNVKEEGILVIVH